MKIGVPVSVILLALLGVVLPWTASAADPSPQDLEGFVWLKDFDAARALAKKDGKPLLVMFR